MYLWAQSQCWSLQEASLVSDFVQNDRHQ